MFTLPEEVSAQTKAGIDQALRFAETAKGATEKLVGLNIQTAKAASADAVSQVKALTSAKDVQELSSLQTSFAQANTEKAVGYARAVYGWATETHGEFSRLVEAQVTEFNRSVAEAIDRASKTAPSGSEFAFAAVKSAVTVANQAYDAMNKAGKQVAGMTEATFNSAANTAEASAVAVAARKKAA